MSSNPCASESITPGLKVKKLEVHVFPTKTTSGKSYQFSLIGAVVAVVAVIAAIFGLRNRQVRFELKVDYGPLNDDFMGTMESFLTATLHSLLDRSLPFSQPLDTKVKPCHFCNFKAICANTEAGALLADDH